MSQSPTSRTLQYCRKHNLLADVAESYNSFTQRRKDLFGFIDLVILDGTTLIGVQVTSTSNMSARRKKILNERNEAATAWLKTGALIEVWGWSKKLEKKGGKRMLWTLNKKPIFDNDLLGALL